MEELREIVKSVKELVKKELKVDDDGNTILDVSGRIYNTTMINKSPKKQQPKKEYSNKPTEKQTALLKKIGKYKDSLTFEEAKKIISDYINKQNNQEV